MAGPYETEAQARTEPLPEEIAAHPLNSNWREISWQYLQEACTAAGVELGAFDEQILRWLCGYEPTTVQVLIGIISRANTNRRD